MSKFNSFTTTSASNISYSNSTSLLSASNVQNAIDEVKTLAVSGAGDVVGPAVATGDAIARYDLGTGKLIKNSTVLIDGTGNITLAENQDVRLSGTSGTVNTPSVTTPLISSDNDLDLQCGSAVGIYITDTAGGEVKLTGSDYAGQGVKGLQVDNTGVVSTFQPTQQDSTGVLSGGLMTINGDTTLFDIATGSGTIVSLGGAKTDVSWGALTAQGGGYTYVGFVTYVSINSSGVAIFQPTVLTPTQHRDQIFLGVLVHVDQTNINKIDNDQFTVAWPVNTTNDLMEAIGFLNTQGNIIAPIGVSLNFQKTVGNMFGFGLNYSTAPKDPHNLSIPAFDSSGAGVFGYDMQNSSASAPTLTLLLPDILDDGSNYPGIAVSNNQWTAQRVYTFPGGTIRVQPGQAEYANEPAAIGAISTETFVVEPSNLSGGMLIGYIIIKEGTTDINDATFLQAGKFQASASGSGSTGDVTGSTTSVLNQIPRYTDTTGKIIKNSLVTVDDAGILNAIGYQLNGDTGTLLYNRVSNNVCSDLSGTGLTGSGDNNVLIGNGAGTALTTQRENVGIGLRALQFNTSNWNVAIGTDAMSSSTGFGNSTNCVAVGVNSLIRINDNGGTGGDGNTAVGGNTGTFISYGLNNSVFGCGSGDLITTGNHNTLIGCDTNGVATFDNQICLGYQTTAIIANEAVIGNGSITHIRSMAVCDLGTTSNKFKDLYLSSAVNAVNSTLTGTMNSANYQENSVSGSLLKSANTSSTYGGAGAGAAIGTSTFSTLIGYQAGNALVTGNENTMIGNDSGLVSNGCVKCTFVGSNSGFTNVDGDSNTGIGANALTLATGDNNTALGSTAGDSIAGGSNNTSIGFASDCKSDGVNQTAIGNGAVCSKSNQIVIGDANVEETVLQGVVLIDPNNVAGGALTISNAATQDSAELVKITGTAGQTALNVATGNTTLDPANPAGGALIISNSIAQTNGSLVSIAGASDETALFVSEGNSIFTKNVVVSGNIFTDNIDAITGVPLLIGPNVASQVDIADAGIITEVKGPLIMPTTTGTFRPPKITTTQRDALTPVNGDVIFNTDTDVLNTFNGTNWENQNLPDRTEYPRLPMTSATTPAPYTITASSNENATYAEFNAFNKRWGDGEPALGDRGWDSDFVGSFSTVIQGATGEVGVQWLQIDLGEAVTITNFHINCINWALRPREFYIVGSTNDSTWNELYYSGANAPWIFWQDELAQFQRIVADLTTTGSYRYYRVVSLLNENGNGSGEVHTIQELRLFSAKETNRSLLTNVNARDVYVNDDLTVKGSMICTSTSGIDVFRPPIVTTVQRDLIPAVEADVIYNSTSNKLNLYTTAWEENHSGSSIKTNEIDTISGVPMLIGKATTSKIELADTNITTEIQGPITGLEGCSITGQSLINPNIATGIGSALRITNTTLQTADSLVSITGVTDETALEVTDGNVVVTDNLTVSGSLTADTSTLGSSIIVFKSYSLAVGLPSHVLGAGTTIFVTDETGGSTLAFSDGTKWRRVSDRAECIA